MDSTLQAIVSMKECGKHRWKEIASHVGVEPDNPDVVRVRYINWQRRLEKGKNKILPGPCPVCSSGVRYKENGNYADISFDMVGAEVLEEALEARGVDLDIWMVSSWEFAQWDVGAKIKKGHLTWVNGRQSGHMDYEGLGKEALCSIRVRLIRREPKPIQPAVQPVSVDVSYLYPPPPMGETERTFIIADVQMGYRKKVRDAKLIPFHDRRVLDIALSICREEQPENILFLGDTADLADWSGKFLKEPSFYFTTQPMIMEGNWWFTQFRKACPDSRIYVFQGNHSTRVPNAILMHLSAAYGLRAADEIDLAPQLSLERMWALHLLGIEWVGNYPDEELWLRDWLRAKHGNRAIGTPGATAKSFLREGVSTIFAHAHRKEIASEIVATRDGPVPIYAYSPGCACHVDGRVPGHKKSDCWQQGLGMVEYHGRSMSISDIGVYEGVASWRGSVIEGRDVVPYLEQDLPDWNW